MSNLLKLIKSYRTERYFREKLFKNIQIQSTPVTANTRKLKAKWSSELAKDVQAYHSKVSVNQIVNIVRSKIDKETK